jgi:ribosomal protein S18 acetylase RimI-like enzyme
VYEAWLADSGSRIWIAETQVGQSPIGYLVSLPSDPSSEHSRDDDLEVKRIYLLNRFRGNGLGRRLMQEAEKSARARGYGRLLLGVYARNKAAIAFYERLGFHKIGDRHYTIGESVYDDTVMGLDLSRPVPAAR